MGNLASNFPLGRAGVALLILRLSIALSIGRASIVMNATPEMAIPLAAICVLIGAGLLTRPAVIICAACAIAMREAMPILVAIPTVCSCIAQYILGAGGFSVDGVVFGSRIVVLRSPADAGKDHGNQAEEGGGIN